MEKHVGFEEEWHWSCLALLLYFDNSLWRYHMWWHCRMSEHPWTQPEGCCLS